MLMVKCRECGSLSDSLARSCPDCGALRPGVRFDADATSAQRTLVAIRNGLRFRILTPRNLLAAAVIMVLGTIAYRATRPTPELVAARAKDAAAAAIVTHDSSVMAAMRADMRRAMTAEEMLFAVEQRYGSFDEVQRRGFAPSGGNQVAILASSSGYTVTVTNATLSSGSAECSLQVGGRGVPDSLNGVIVCSDPRAHRPLP